MDLSSKVALLNVNYRRPYWVVTLAEASILSCSAAPTCVCDGKEYTNCNFVHLYEDIIEYKSE